MNGKDILKTHGFLFLPTDIFDIANLKFIKPEIAEKFVEAAKIYADHPAALQLRAMNIIYETTKERGTTILIPTPMVDSMNPASALVLASQRAPSEGVPSLKSVA